MILTRSASRVPRTARLVLVLATVSAVVSGVQLFAPSTEAAFLGEERSIDPLPTLPTRCRVEPAAAVAHARTAERMAHVHWERMPLAVDEAHRALALIGEAELCYGARDREGRVRAAALRRAYEAEITRRFLRARLLLRVALRAQRLDRARQQIATLRALLVAVKPEIQAYRSELERLDRSYAAQLSQQAGKGSP